MSLWIIKPISILELSNSMWSKQHLSAGRYCMLEVVNKKCIYVQGILEKLQCMYLEKSFMVGYIFVDTGHN